MKAPIDWLLSGEPWVAYRTRIDLLGESEKSSAVRACRTAMLESPLVQGLLKELSGWPGKVVSSHKSAGQPYHKLTFIADLGLDSGDPPVAAVITRIMSHRSEEGPFTLPMNIPTHFGGTGKDQWAWALCDAPLIAYALSRFGLEKDPAVRKTVDRLVGLSRDFGWPCAVSKELGSFHGPGKKDDPCPFANLAMLKLLSTTARLRSSPAARAGVETLLMLWKESRKRHPYMFTMGTDFRKLKAPLIWYDLLHVLDVLSRFPEFRPDARLLEMTGLLASKADREGRFTAESVWTAWKDWEFGQKRDPSKWLTLLAHRIEARVRGA